MKLTNFAIREKDGNDYYEMPCWIVSYSFNNPDNGFTWDEILEQKKKRREQWVDDTQDCLIINAVDGSTVHPLRAY